MSTSSKKKIGILAGIMVIAALGIWWAGRPDGGVSPEIAHARAATIYKSPTCGCCGQYVSYLKREGFDVEIVEQTDMQPIKEQYGIPYDVESCHTSVIDGYVFEGHIPAEAIEQFLTDRPDSEGIALPGMPTGSPGMPGRKRAPFPVHSFSGGRATFYQNF